MVFIPLLYLFVAMTFIFPSPYIYPRPFGQKSLRDYLPLQDGLDCAVAELFYTGSELGGYKLVRRKDVKISDRQTPWSFTQVLLNLELAGFNSRKAWIFIPLHDSP